MKEQHLLVDYENVQPSMDDLLKIAPKLTDVWLFHGPNQTKRAEQLQAVHGRVTLVPHSGKGKNALDFHLSFYLGYVAAKHPDATLVIVANDKGYDSMLGHANLLGFTATRTEFKVKKALAAKKVASAKKVVAATKTLPIAESTTAAPSVAQALSTVPLSKKVAASAKKAAPEKLLQGAAKKVPTTVAKTKLIPAKAPAAKKVATKKSALTKAPPKKTAAKKVPAKNVPAKDAATKALPKAQPAQEDKVLARAKTALVKMGKNRPTKLAPLLRHLRSMVGLGATADDADMLSRRLEDAKVIQVVGDMVLYPVFPA